MNKILTVKEDKVVINEVVLSIPELKSVLDYYTVNEDRETAILALTFLHYMYDPESPYWNQSADIMESNIRKDFRGRYNPKFDEVMINAANKLEEFETPISRAVRALKNSLDKLSTYLTNTEISTGRDGNMAEVLRAHEKYPIILRNFRSAVKDFTAEITKNRGNSKSAIDEDDDTDDFK